jgi:hypothetical protein
MKKIQEREHKQFELIQKGFIPNILEDLSENPAILGHASDDVWFNLPYHFYGSTFMISILSFVKSTIPGRPNWIVNVKEH